MSSQFASWFICLALLFGLACSASTEADLLPDTRWADPSAVHLEVEFPGDDYHATWDLFRCVCGDLLVRSELTVPGEVERGETMLVSGRVILSRGFGEHQAEMGASLDAPALMMQLALSLLERTRPQGPSASSSIGELALEEPINPIHLDSGSAAGSFWAPWSVEGSVQAPSTSQRRFDLRFRFSTGNPGEELAGSMRLSGTAEYTRNEFPLNEDTPLQGWAFSWRDESDPAAGPADGAETLAQLREVIQANEWE